jgi:gliding motility-associated-like protein
MNSIIKQTFNWTFLFFGCLVHQTLHAAYLNRPELVDYNFAGANICEKVALRIKFDHEQFIPGNVFTVEVSPNGQFSGGNTYVMIGSLTQSGNQQNVFLTVNFPANIPAGANYRLRVKGSSPLTYSQQVNEHPFSISKLVPSDPNFYPEGYWRGYFYRWTPSIPGTINDANTEDIFNPNNYLGYITEDSLSFDYNWGNNTSAPHIFPDTNNVCGTYRDFFSIRMRRRIAFEEGYYVIGGGADDGFRISLDGGITWVLSDWSDHAYRGSLQNNGCGIFLTAGVRDVVVDFYENKTDARFRLVLLKTGDPAVNPISIVSPANGATICTSAGLVPLTGAPPGAWQWSGPGVIHNGFLNPAVGGTGPRTITYQTGFSAFGQNCVKTTSITVNVVNGLSAAFSGLQPGYCTTANPVNLSPQNPGGIFSGPGISGNQFSPTSAGPGTHTIQHILNTPGGCSDTVQLIVEVSAPVTPLLNVPSSLCSFSSPIALTANVSGTFSGPGVSNNQFDPAQALTGDNTITFTSNQGFCQVSATATISVQQQPNTSISLSRNSFCINQPGKSGITLSPPGGLLSGPGVQGDSLAPQGLGSGIYTLQYITGGICPDTGIATFQVFELPDAGFNNLPDTVCEGSANITLVPNTPGGSFVGQGVIPPNQFSPGILPVNNTYQIEYRITQNGCFNRTEQFVNILDKLKPTLSFPTLKARYCRFDPVFSPVSNPPGRYFLNGQEVTNIDPTALAPGNYSLLAVFRPASDLSCIDSSSARFAFTIIDNPRPDLGPDIELESGQSIRLDPKVSGPYTWTMGESGLDPASGQPFEFQPTIAQEVSVLATDPTGTCSGSDAIQISVREKLEFPTLFTPNGDQANQVWRIKGAYQNMKVTIFDRWGKKVHSGLVQNEIGWTGEGSDSKKGLFYFLVEHPSDGRNWTGWVMMASEK